MLSNRFYWILTILICSVHAVASVIIGISEFNLLHFHGDYASIMQPVYNIAHFGEQWSSFNCSVHEYWSILGTPKQLIEIPELAHCNQLGIHFHAMIYPLAVLEYLLRSPFLLIYVQAFLVSASGVALFYLALKETKVAWISFLILISYLVNPFMHGLLLNDFHFDAFLPILIFPLTLCLAGGKLWKALILSILGFLTKESFALVLVGFGCFQLFYLTQRRRVFQGLGLIAFGVFGLWFFTCVVIPYFSHIGTYMFGGAYGSPLGSSPTEIVMNFILHPINSAHLIFSPQNNHLLLLLLGASSPLIFLAPQYLFITGPLLFINLVSSNGAMKIAWGQYNVVCVCAASIAAVYGTTFLLRRAGKLAIIAKILVALSLIMNIVVAYNMSPINNLVVFPPKLTNPLHEVMAKYPTESMCADDTLAVFAARRKEMYITPVNLARCEVVLWQDSPSLWYMKKGVRSEILKYIEANFERVEKVETTVVYKRKIPEMAGNRPLSAAIASQDRIEVTGGRRDPSTT